LVLNETNERNAETYGWTSRARIVRFFRLIRCLIMALRLVTDRVRSRLSLLVIAAEVIGRAVKAGILLTARGGNIVARGPVGAVTDALAAEIRSAKPRSCGVVVDPQLQRLRSLCVLRGSRLLLAPTAGDDPMTTLPGALASTIRRARGAPQ
jgi:hypothetical protein